jgi:hypothetical protein
MNQELSGEPRLETAGKPSQMGGVFRTAHRRSHPEGNGCYCADQNAVTSPGGTTPPKGPVKTMAGRARETGRRGASGPGKVRETSSIGRCDKPHHPTAKPTQPERQEVRPVTRGQRPAKSRRRPRGNGADAQHTFAGVSAPRPARRSRQEATEPGEEASLNSSRPETARTVPP